MTIQDKPALILIDVQKGLDNHSYYGGNRNNPNAEENMKKLLKFWRQHGLPIFHIKHNSTNPESPLYKIKAGNEIKEIVSPLESEPVIEKNVNSAFIGTDLRRRLENDAIKHVVMMGLTTDHCVSTSVRMAGNFGFNTFLVSDATATFDKVGVDGKKYSAEVMHETALASLNNEFATVLKTVEVMKMLDVNQKFGY